jgi:hypothetical protein
MLVSIFINAECDEGKTDAVLLGHDDEAELFERVREVVCGASEGGHNGTVAVFSKTDQLVVLANDLGSTFGEVEGEGGLVCAKVVDVEDQFFREEFGGAPDDPSYTGVDKSIPECSS